MQLIAEAYDLIRRGTGKTPAEIADIFAEWNAGELESYLIEITAEVLRQVDEETGKPLVDVILDQAGSKGTGVWTVQNALDLGIPVSGIAEAVFARSLSSKPAQRAAASACRVRRRSRRSTTRMRSSRTCARRSTRRRSSPTRRASMRSSRAPSSTAGTSRRARSRRSGVADASSARASSTGSPRPTPPTPDSSRWSPRRSSSTSSPAPRRPGAAWSPTRPPRASRRPAFSSSLAYYDGLRADRLPAALVQGQRDFFGAHTYGRVDKEGTFHTLWSGDRTEVQAVDTH